MPTSGPREHEHERRQQNPTGGSEGGGGSPVLRPWPVDRIALDEFRPATVRREIASLTAQLQAAQERAERWKAEAAKFIDWFDAPHSKGGINLDWFDRDGDTGMAMLVAMEPLEDMLDAARALNDTKEPSPTTTEPRP